MLPSLPGTSVQFWSQLAFAGAVSPSSYRYWKLLWVDTPVFLVHVSVTWPGYPVRCATARDTGAGTDPDFADTLDVAVLWPAVPKTLRSWKS